jgi:hypothetical protein
VAAGVLRLSAATASAWVASGLGERQRRMDEDVCVWATCSAARTCVKRSARRVSIHQYRDTTPEAAVKQTQRGEDSCFSRLDYFCGKHQNDPGECGVMCGPALAARAFASQVLHGRIVKQYCEPQLSICHAEAQGEGIRLSTPDQVAAMVVAAMAVAAVVVARVGGRRRL